MVEYKCQERSRIYEVSFAAGQAVRLWLYRQTSGRLWLKLMGSLEKSARCSRLRRRLTICVAVEPLAEGAASPFVA